MPIKKLKRVLIASTPMQTVIKKSKGTYLPGFSGFSLFEIWTAFRLQLKKTSLLERAAAISYNIVYLNETNADLFCPKVDEKWSGAIPASLLINNKTGYKKFFEEQIAENKLEEEIKALINK